MKLHLGYVGPVLGRCAGMVMALTCSAVLAEEHQIYRCGSDYNNTMTAKEAVAKGCKTIEGAPITIIQAIKRPKAAQAAGSTDEKVSPADQRERDNDARRILQQELAKEQAELTQMQKEYNNGQPERQGDEKNYQKYLDRTAAMKAAIERKQADIQAIQHELSKMSDSMSGSS